MFLWRWRTPVNINPPRRLMADVRVGPYVLPAGTDVMPNMFSCLHDPELYPEPDTFRPERWLSGEYTGHITFTGEAQGSVGKLTTNDQTREDLGWEPTFESFEAFMKAGAKDTFCSTEQGE